METVKTFVREDDTATIVCPACGIPKNVSVASYKNKTAELKVRCTCNTVFKVALDFRRFYRKSTNLPGRYKTLDPLGHGSGAIHIVNISKGGLGFSVSGINTIEKDYRLEVSFQLDDKKMTSLQKEVIVQSVEGDFVGCRFSSSELYEKELGFYLTG